MFNKKKDPVDKEPELSAKDSASEVQDEVGDPQVAETPTDDSPEGAEASVLPRTLGEGPFDSVDFVPDGVDRLDFGALKVPGVEDTHYNLEVDEETQVIVAVTAIREDGAVQIQPFAAPKSPGFWDETKEELKAGLLEQGGTVEDVPGSFGNELSALMPALDEDGNEGLQTVRFVAVEGPRWLVRAAFLGTPAVDERKAEVFEDIVRSCVVERGNQPMAPGDLLELKVPEGAETVDEDESGELEDADSSRPDLDPFERGPEITEIR